MAQLCEASLVFDEQQKRFYPANDTPTNGSLTLIQFGS